MTDKERNAQSRDQQQSVWGKLADEGHWKRPVAHAIFLTTDDVDDDPDDDLDDADDADSTTAGHPAGWWEYTGACPYCGATLQVEGMLTTDELAWERAHQAWRKRALRTDAAERSNGDGQR